MLKYLPFHVLIVIILCHLLYSCKKETGGNNPPAIEPIATDRGNASGTPSSKMIGASGGELISPDGKLRVIVSPGTVASNTEFRIQPITNTLFDGDADRLAYRLQPEATTFSKPVKLEFSYTNADLERTIEDVMTVAWQQPDGSWKIEPTQLDKATKTLVVETSHFSDWTVTGGFELRVQKEVLRPGEKSKLTVVTATGNDLLAHLTVSSADDATLTALGKWKIIEGDGTLEAKPSGPKGFVYEATYSAPATVSGLMSVVVTMEVEGFNRIKDPSAPGGMRRTGKMILFGRMIVSDNYLIGTLDGVPFGFFGNNVIATSMSGLIAIRAADGSGEITLSVNGSTAGSYPCGQFILPGKAGVSIGAPGEQSFFYTHTYIACGQIGEQVFSPAGVEITKWPAVGQPAEGSFSGPVYLADGICGPRSKYLELRFSVTRGL